MRCCQSRQGGRTQGCKGKTFSIVQVKALWGPRETTLEAADVQGPLGLN